MLIENAFLKLPELLTSHYDHGDIFEATVVHLFAVAILMELNSRNIPRPFEHVYTEKPYRTKDSRFQADLFVSLEDAVPTRGRMKLYRAREKNWIEAKAFLSSTRQASAPSKPKNAGRILRDLLRLCLLPEEIAWPCQHGRYLLVVFSGKPSRSIPMSKGRGRIWLSSLLTEGSASLQVNLANEIPSLQKAVGQGFVQPSGLEINLRVHTMMFEPEGNEPSPVYWGYLTRIRYFKIGISGHEVEYEDRVGQTLNSDYIKRLDAVRHEVVARL